MINELAYEFETTLREHLVELNRRISTQMNIVNGAIDRLRGEHDAYSNTQTILESFIRDIRLEGEKK